MAQTTCRALQIQSKCIPLDHILLFNKDYHVSKWVHGHKKEPGIYKKPSGLYFTHFSSEERVGSLTV